MQGFARRLRPLTLLLLHAPSRAVDMVIPAAAAAPGAGLATFNKSKTAAASPKKARDVVRVDAKIPVEVELKTKGAAYFQG